MTELKTEKDVLEFWDDNKTFQKSLNKTKKGKHYIFYDGPPFATGLPHYGHILASTIKDTIPRFWTMNGRFVKRVWGWDCHGLPVENIAEKELNINSKAEIEKIGVEKFNDFCRSKVLTYAKEWGKTVHRMGRWVEFDNAYKTMDNNYMESVIWAFKQLYEKKFIYEGEKILMYCTRCATPLSKSEVSMDNSYKTVKDDTVTVKFKLEDEDVYALAWTTTPWTLPSNLALTVNPNMEYVYVQDSSDSTVYLVGKNLIQKYFKNPNEYKIIKTVSGKKLEGIKYEPLFPYFSKLKNSFKIILGDFVTEAEGTGIVHTAPAFGEDDYNICKRNGIDMVQPVDERGRFTEEIKDFAGEYIFESNRKIIDFLKAQQKVVKIERKSHEYPFCYRCETPLMYRAVPSWFVNVQKIKSKMLALNEKMNWFPEFIKEGRFKHNVETAPDWNISRNRYWATAIPVWKCSGCKNIEVIGSIDELKKKAIKLPKKEVDLHKDYLDKVKLKCKCGKDMIRVPEVLDCWFESGSMPFAQFHYPFENKKYFDDNFPAEFVAEYIGQTRAWFYYCLVMSTILFGDIPFKNVVVTGTILAEDGEKMSKSKGNFPDPYLLIDKYGVDALRYYLLSNPVMSAESLNFSEKGVDEVHKKVVLILNNINNFYKDYQIKEKKEPKSKNLLDIWVISRLNETIKNSTNFYHSYNTIKACEEIRKFVDDLSTWYVRRNRDRFNNEDKDAINTLRFVLEELSKVMAPMLPFTSEIIYNNMNNKTSVHLEGWPSYKEKLIKKDVNEKMSLVRNIVSIALRERDRAKVSLRQPLAKAEIAGASPLSKDYLDIIAEEINVKMVIQNDNIDNKINVQLDFVITPELEAEGFAREVARKIQAERKAKGLKKGEMVELKLYTSEKLSLMLKPHLGFLKERTNASKLALSDDKKGNGEILFTVKEEKISISFL